MSSGENVRTTSGFAPLHRTVGAVLLVVFVVLCVAVASGWEPAHDEGVTWDQAFGSLGVPRHPQAPTAIQPVLERLDARDAHSLSDVVASLMARGGMHPPLYYWGLNLWARTVGTERLWLCAPAIALSVASLILLGGLARRVIGDSEAVLWVMALAASSSWFIGYTVLARPYALAIFIGLAATRAAVFCAEGPARSAGSLRAARIAFVALSALGLYTLYHYAFVLVWHGALLIVAAWLGPRVERVRGVALATAMGVAISLLYLPWLPRLAVHLALTGGDTWYFAGALPLTEWPQGALSLARLFALGGLHGSFLYRALLWPLALSSAGCFVWSIVWSLRSGAFARQGPTVQAFWATLPLWPLSVAAADLWHDTHTLFLSKTVFLALPLVALGIVQGWRIVGVLAVRRGALALMVGLALTASIQNLILRAQQPHIFERVAARLVEVDGPGSLIVMSSDRRGYLVPMMLSLREAGVRESSVLVATGNDLEGLLVRAMAQASVERVILLDFNVIYQADESWGTDRLRSLQPFAKAIRWAPLNLMNRERAPPLAAGQKRLWIAGPLQAKFYSR